MMSERFEKWNDCSCKVKDNQENILNWEDVVDLLNEQQATISALKEENEQLRKQIQNYEQLIANSYVGEEETLDGFVGKYVIWENELQKYKSNVLEYPKSYNHYHPTEKPVPLLKDLILTYSDAGDTILDFTMGSGSTGVACLQTDRNFIGIELDAEYYEMAKQRIRSVNEQGKLV